MIIFNIIINYILQISNVDRATMDVWKTNWIFLLVKSTFSSVMCYKLKQIES